MKTHDFTTGYKTTREYEDCLLYNIVKGTKRGIKENDNILLKYNSRIAKYLVINIEYSRQDKTRQDKT